MLSSRKKSANYGEIQSGETLFDFLKRKKKFALEKSISKSRCKENVQDNSQRPQQSYSPKKACEEAYKENLRDSSYNYQTTRRASNLPTTPKRVTFSEAENKKPSGRASFVEMISPLRRRNADSSKTPEPAVLSKSRGKQKQDAQEIFHRKNLNKSIGVIKSTLQKMINSGKSLKQKAHTLFVQLKPLLKFIQDGQNANFSRRAEDAKIKLRTFEHMFREFDIENGNEMVEEFHRNLSEHLISMEGNLRSNYERNEIDTLRKMKVEKDNKIDQLISTQAELQKQIQLLTRKLDRSEKNATKLQKNSQFQSENASKTLSTKMEDYERKLSQYEAEISQLAIEIDESKTREKHLEKEVKDLKYLKEEAEKRFIQENIRIKSSQEQCLLNEMEMLKKQFKNDMSQITHLYTSKEQEQIAIIDELRKQIEEFKQQRICDKDIEAKLLAECSNGKNQIDKFKQQNECLVTDLHRMNEELYQHWLALKDIKTLSTRLGSFNKFIKIYNDMAYNDQLFL